MLMFFFNTTFAIFIAATLLTVAKLTMYHSNSHREKMSPFECGFDPKNSARSPFSLRFFLLAVLFLVFDIEIALLLPAPITMASTMSLFSTAAAFLFFFILLLGLIHEWREGSLDWTM